MDGPRHDDPLKCPCAADCPYHRKEHQQDHEFVRAAMEVMAKLRDLKWSTLRALVMAAAFMVVGLLGMGLADKIKDIVGL